MHIIIISMFKAVFVWYKKKIGSMNGPGADIPDTILDTCRFTRLCIKIKVLSAWKL